LNSYVRLRRVFLSTPRQHVPRGPIAELGDGQNPASPASEE
jgi:hypothetical protein